MTLLEWLEKYCKELDNSDNPFTFDAYKSGFNAGCHSTKRSVVKHLRDAIEQEKLREKVA